MSDDIVIKVENISKYYRLGVIGSSTIRSDFERWWCYFRGKPDPYMKIGQQVDSTTKTNKISDAIWALRNVSFDVKQGEVVGIIGRNGAGKSTILKILSRVTAPTEGEINIKGRIASLLEVGTGFHPELTGRENVFINGAILGMTKSEIKKKFNEIVDFAEVEKFIDTPVKRYSSGMYVRLAFAVAAHLEPEILIVDEVLAVGDLDFQRKCLGKMKDVSKKGRTVLFVSHNMSAIQRLCSRSILLKSGSCIYDGKTERTIEKYLSFGAHKGHANFDSMTVRSGSGQVKFISVRLLNQDGTTANTVMMGNDFTVEIKFECYSTIINPSFGVRIHTILNQNIASWSSKNTYEKTSKISNHGLVHLTVKELNLLPGTYVLAIGLSDEHQILDLIEDALEIEVVISKKQTNRRLPKPEYGMVYFPCSWDFTNLK